MPCKFVTNMCTFYAQRPSMMKKLTICHTKFIMLISNPSDDKQGHTKSFILKPIRWIAIFDVSQQIFGSVVGGHHSKALFDAHLLKVKFQASLTLQKCRCLWKMHMQTYNP